MTLISCIELYHFWTSQLCAPINPRLFGLNWYIRYLLLHSKLLQNLVAGKKHIYYSQFQYVRGLGVTWMVLAQGLS